MSDQKYGQGGVYRVEDLAKDLKHEAALSAARDRVVKAALTIGDIHNSACVCVFCEAVRDLKRLTALAKEGGDGG